MAVLQFKPRKRSDPAQTVVTFESAAAEVLAREQPLAKRSVLYVLAALIGFIIAFISFAHLDRVVTATGRIVPTAGSITVQPLEKAIIGRILVAVGDVVKKGQVLATLDPTFVQADLTQLQQKVASLTPEKRRLEAEEADQPFQADPRLPYDALQDAIYKKRATELHAAILDYDQRINSSEAQIVGLRQSITDYQARMKVATETEAMYVQMEKDQTASHLQLLTVQDLKLEAARKLDDAQNSLAATEHLLESLKAQRKVYIDKWHDDNLNDLVSVKNDLEQAENELKKASKRSDLINLMAPVDAVVLKIPTLSAGGVTTDAEPLFSLMPTNAPIEADVQIDTRDSGFVRIGDPVKIKFETFKFLEHGTAEGVVKTVSADSFTEERTQDAMTLGKTANSRSPYFDARVTITAVKLHNVPANFRIVPGMTLQADIIVGRRTILWYLIGGALRSGSEAMREP